MRDGIRRWGMRLCWAVMLGSTGALGGLHFGRPLYYTDGSSAVFAANLADASMLGYRTPEPVCELPGPVQGRVAELPDGRLLYGRTQPAGDTDLVVFDPTRPGLEPEPAYGLDTGAHELAPAVLADGTVYFASDRAGGIGGFDLYVASYRGGRFSTPQPVAPCNTAKDETDPAPAADGHTLVFARVEQAVRNGDNGALYLADLTSGLEPQPVFPFEGQRRVDLRPLDRDPVLAADGHALWFVRKLPGQPAHVYCSVRQSGAFDTPLQKDGSFGARDLRSPLPSPDGLGLHLLQPGPPALWFLSRVQPLYPWWAGQRTLELLLLGAALFAGLLLLLLHLGRRWRTLDLVTQCLLLSLLIHILVMLWLMGVEITGSVLPGDDAAGGIEVTLIQDASGSSAAADGPRSEDLAATIAFQPAARDLAAAAPATDPAAAARAAGGELAPDGAFRSDATPQRSEAAAADLSDAAAAPALRAAAAAELATAATPLPGVTPVANAAPAARSEQDAGAAKFQVGVPAATLATAERQRLDGGTEGAPATAAATARPLAVATATPQDAGVAAPPRQASDPATAIFANGSAASIEPAAALAAPSPSRAVAAANAASDAVLAAAPAAALTPAARSSELAPAAAATRSLPVASAPADDPRAALRDAAAALDPVANASAGGNSAAPLQPLAAVASAPVADPSASAVRSATASAPTDAAAIASPASALAHPARDQAEVSGPGNARAMPAAAARQLAVAPPLRDIGGATASPAASPTVASGGASPPALQPVAAASDAGPRAVVASALRSDTAADSGPIARDLQAPASALASPSRAPTAMPDAGAPAVPQAMARAQTPRQPLRDRDFGVAAAGPAVAAAKAAPAPAGLVPLPPASEGPAAATAVGERGATAAAGAAGGVSAPPLPRSALARPGTDIAVAAPPAAMQLRQQSQRTAGMPPLRDRDPGKSAAPASASRSGGEAGLRPLLAYADTKAPQQQQATASARRGGSPGIGAMVAPLPGSLLERAESDNRSLPQASAPIAASGAYSNRFGPARQQALEQYGGTAATERAVAQGLRYLASIQNTDGSWGERSHFDDKYGNVYIGKSALCLLAFLGAGHTPASHTEYSGVVQQAVRHLLSVQAADTGAFGVSSAYGHGISTYALAECYGLTKDPQLLRPVEAGLSWILQHQGPRRDRKNQGGWGYFSPGLQPEDDYARVSVSAWMIMALESARLSGIELPDDVLPRARRFLEGAFDADNGWFRYNHKPSRLNSAWPTLPASTPAGAFGLMLLGEDKDTERIRAAVDFTVERRPTAYRRFSDDEFVLRAQGNVYFWYYGSLACFLRGGDAWTRWNEKLSTVLPQAQDDDGSFAPIDVYARYAGDTAADRSYTTAMCVLSLEIYYRYFTPLLLGR